MPGKPCFSGIFHKTLPAYKKVAASPTEKLLLRPNWPWVK